MKIPRLHALMTCVKVKDPQLSTDASQEIGTATLVVQDANGYPVVGRAHGARADRAPPRPAWSCRPPAGARLA